MNKRSTLSLVLFFACLMLGLGLLYGPVLFGFKVLYFRDILHNYYPFIDFIKRSIWKGDFPFWNPFIFSGNPQIAGLEPAVFYPLAVMFLVLPYQLALALNLCLHHLIAAAGIYLLGQQYRWSPLASMLASLCFTFGGVMVSMNNFHPLQNTVAWMPVLIYLAHRLCQEQRLRLLLWFTLAYGLQILTGHLEIVYFTSVLLLIYASLFLRAQGVKLMVWLGFALAFGILLSAVQLVPSLMYVPLSVRKMGLHSAEATLWSYHPWLSYMFVLPENNGNVFEGVALNMVFGDNIFGNALFFVNTYMGLFAWLGLILLVLNWKSIQERKFVIFWLILLIFSLLMAYGHHLPTGQWLVHIPGMSFFRYPSKFLVLTSLAFSVLAGWGLHELETKPERLRQLVFVTLGFAGFCILAAACLWLFRESVESDLMSRMQKLFQKMTEQMTQGWAKDSVDQIFVQLMRQVFVCLALAGGAWVLQRRGFKNLALTVFVLTIACLDLISSSVNAVWLSSPDIMAIHSPVADFFRERGLPKRLQERYMVGQQVTSIPQSFRSDLENMGYFKPILYHMQSLGDNYGLLNGFRSAYGSWPARSHLAEIFYEMHTGDPQHPNLEVRNHLESQNAVRYLVLPNPSAQTLSLYEKSKNYKQLEAFFDINTYVFENLNWMPRARFYYQSAAVKDEDILTAAFANPKAYNINPQKNVVLLEDQNLKLARTLVPSQEAKIKQWTPPQIVSESNNRVELAFETNTSGYLVLADQYIQGWKAYDNGKEVPILRANFLHRALRVGPGKHQIVYEYQAPGFLAGLLATALSTLLWLILLIWSLRHPGEKPAEETARIV